MPAQPANTWSVQPLNADGSNDGPARTLADLGIESANYDLNNLAADTLAFTVGGKEVDAAALWPYGTLLAVLKPDNTRFFVGRVEPWTRDGRNDGQNHLGRLVNPWWYLERKVYEQTYRIVDQMNTDPTKITYTTITTPRVVLNVLFDGTTGFYAATTGQQIADAVNWAISQGAPIRLGTVDPATKPFSDFQKGIFVADVIKLQFRKEPDFVMDWDYTTLPFPTVHFRKPASLAPVTIDLTVPGVREQVSIKERPDWQRSYVKINYDQTNSSDGGQYLATYADWYSKDGQGNATNGVATGAPLPVDAVSRFNGVDLFCDLTGANTSSSTQTGEITSKAVDFASLATWREWKPALAAENIRYVQIMTAASTPPANATFRPPTIWTLDELGADGKPTPYDVDCAYELVDGDWGEWMTGVKAQRCRLIAWAFIVYKNGKVSTEQITHDLTLVSVNTDGQRKSYTRQVMNTQQYAEQPPVGLARSMWESWQKLAIEGGFTNVAAVTGSGQTISRATSLNFLTDSPGVAGRPDWSNVQALVQRISGNIERGAQRVDFGAPLRITGNDLIDAVRATRYRTTTIDLGYLFGGALGGGTAGSGGGMIKMGRKNYSRSTHSGSTHKNVDVISNVPEPISGTDPIVKTDGATGIQTWQPADNTTPTATVDPTKCKGSDGKYHAVTFQEQKVCVKIGGVLKQRTLIAWTSETYQAPDDPA